MDWIKRIINSTPTIEIILTRDSVCMSDDIYAPHERIINTSSFDETGRFIKNISSKYLPKINGKNHNWECYLNK